MYFPLSGSQSWTLLLTCIIIVHPSQQIVSDGQFSPEDIKLKRFSNAIAITIHEEIPDLIPYQVFLQILFRLPEANVKNLVVFKQPSSKKEEGASYVIHSSRMNSDFTDRILNSKMLHEIGITTDETNDDGNIQDFINHYLPDYSIRYYTCESFIFTLINDAFQWSENLDYLIKLRMIVTDLHNMLRFKLGGLFLDKSTSNGPFYKAEIMLQDKLHLLKQGTGKYITFQSFLSTTTNESRALDLINKTGIDHKKQAIILYAIEMNDENDIQQFVQPLANITSISCTSHEPEIMFSIGQTFKIHSIIQNEITRVWTVYLRVMRTNDIEHLTTLTHYYLSKIVVQEVFYNGIQARVNYEPLTITTFVTIGDYYSSILVKNYDRAEFYYEKFLEELESPHKFIFEDEQSYYSRKVHRLFYLSHGHINLQLARIRYEQQKYTKSSQYSQNALEAYSRLPHNSHQQFLFAPVYNIFAQLCWEYSGEYDQVAKYYLHALQADRNNVETFINIGVTQSSAELYLYALNSFSTALSIIETLNETDYLSYGLIYRTVGQVYEKSKDIEQALLYYWKSESIYEKSIPSDHELRQKIRDDIKRIITLEDHIHNDL